ncbi:MAG: arginine--tRNA ligase [Candidatus Liptonbacteria bacterium]|nr:arginine--tRNA ligase [Candidatus Liptonbacteria bacterium]
MRKKIEHILQKALGAKAEFDVLIPEQEAFGHYSTNAALKLAKLEKKNPLEIAGQIVAKIEKIAPRGFFEKIEIANPGFINFWISKEMLRKEFNKIAARPACARNDGIKGAQFKNKKVIVEFTDPNPFKEFHIGHLYNNIIGETLSRLLEANGAKVKRANYQGDVGMHVAKAVWGMQEKMTREKTILSKLEKRTLEYRIRFMGESYAAGARAYEENPGAKLEMVELNKKIFSLDRDIKDLYRKSRKWSLQYFERIYKRLGTKFDFYYFEREMGTRGLELVKAGLKKEIFMESEGAVIFPGEKYGLHARVFVNSYGLPTYEAKELGLAFKKRDDFPFDISVSVTGNEITDYFKVLVMALKQIDPRLSEKIRHIPHGMVRLPEGKMSSRTGDVIRAEDLLDDMKQRVLKVMKSTQKEKKRVRTASPEIAEAIAVGAVKYSFLKSSPGSDIIFDFEKSLSLHGDSGPYLQYTYARLKSILRKAKYATRDMRHATRNTFLLNQEHELRLIRKLVEFPETVRKAAEDYAPNHLATYLYEFGALANRYYESTPILKDKDKARRNARLVLVSTASAVLKSGLGLLGIKAPEKI